MKRLPIFVIICMFLGVVIAMAQSGEFVDTEVGKHGYAFKLPNEFSLKDQIGETTTWIYRPDDATGELTIYVIRMGVEGVSPSNLFETNKKSDLDKMKSPDSEYTDLKVLDIDGGLAYWYKEVDKNNPDEIHRWHVKMFGNGGIYTIGLCGPFKDFEKWGPIYEEVVKSFGLIPMN